MDWIAVFHFCTLRSRKNAAQSLGYVSGTLTAAWVQVGALQPAEENNYYLCAFVKKA